MHTQKVSYKYRVPVRTGTDTLLKMEYPCVMQNKGNFTDKGRLIKI
jgi:hypothetical protein